jgi:hypothetical protein
VGSSGNGSSDGGGNGSSDGGGNGSSDGGGNGSSDGGGNGSSDGGTPSGQAAADCAAEVTQAMLSAGLLSAETSDNLTGGACRWFTRLSAQHQRDTCTGQLDAAAAAQLASRGAPSAAVGPTAGAAAAARLGAGGSGSGRRRGSALAAAAAAALAALLLA